MERLKSRLTKVMVNEVEELDINHNTICVGDFVRLKCEEDYDDTSYMTLTNISYIYRYGGYVCEVLKVSDDVDAYGYSTFTVVTSEGDVLLVKHYEIEEMYREVINKE